MTALSEADPVTSAVNTLKMSNRIPFARTLSFALYIALEKELNECLLK